MTIRRKGARLRVVSAAQRLDEGRPSRSRAGATSTRVEIDGSIASFAAALAVEHGAVLAAAGDARAVHAARRRLARRRHETRRALGPDAARALDVALVATRLDAAALAGVDEVDVRARLVEGAGRAMATARELNVGSIAGLAAVARGCRLAALADAIIDRAARTLDADALRLATSIAGAARLELLGGVELDRRARLVREEGDAGAGIDRAFANELLSRERTGDGTGET